MLERFWKGNMFKPGTAYVLKGVIVASAVVGGAYVVYKLCDKMLGDECDTWQNVKRNYFVIVGWVTLVIECYFYYQMGFPKEFGIALLRWGLAKAKELGDEARRRRSKCFKFG